LSTIFDKSIRISRMFWFLPDRRVQEFEKMLSTARSFDIDDDDRFCDVIQVKQPGNTAEASIIVYTAHKTVETTVASERNSVQKSKLKERTPSLIWGDATIIRFVSAKFGVRTN
jgi:hypothetical protein